MLASKLAPAGPAADRPPARAAPASAQADARRAAPRRRSFNRPAWCLACKLYTDVDEKVLDYLDAGARMVLIVNPRKQTVTIYRSRAEISILGPGDQLDGADVLPGWSLPVSAIFM